MFILHSSNRTENLVAHLAQVIRQKPLSSPFQKELFLIQSQGMERWLSQQLALEFKVWGNYDFLFPSKFFSSLAEKIDAQLNDAAFDRHLLIWRIESLLRHLNHEALLPLKHYLSGDSIALKRYQLAFQIAKVFDQYQIMRPDILEKWQADETVYHGTKQQATEYWQKILWQAVIQQTDNKHRGSLWLDVINKLNHAEQGLFKNKLPERVCIFGVNTMPPLFLHYLNSLAKHTDVHLFLLNPCADFWADLDTKRQQIAKNTFDEFYGHSLLANLGQQGREFQALILEENTEFALELESFEEHQFTPNNLQQLQNDILNNNTTPTIKLQPDNSISIHACYSRLREVEVLKNQLLHALENDKTLELRDIVVIAPDIQKYESFISAVFSDIQHAIADRSLRLSNHALDAFIRFLSVSQSRFGWQTVLDLLEQEVVYNSFSLTETDLDLIRHWVQDMGVRWGKSAQHKKSLGLPELSENTWQAMLNRLLMGYAVGNDDQFVQGVLPYKAIEGSSALALGGLCDFMALLFKASSDLKTPRTLKDWCDILIYYADLLLTNVDLIELQQLKELFAQLATADTVHTDTVELQVIISWLEGTVSEHKSSNGFLRGQLTFCSMLPMRSIPFKIIGLLGMNDGEFPKVDRSPTFDLISQDFRKGDRSRRADDRYQFLELLLSARQHLIMTYIGMNISQNTSVPPSVVISELLDVLKDSYDFEQPIIQEPLQSFSWRYFDGYHDSLINYSKSDLDTAKAISNSKYQSKLWWQGEIDAEEPQLIDVTELFNFFRHPQKYFFNQQLGVRFSQLETKVEEREPFKIEALDGYSIYQQWIELLLNGDTVSVDKMQAQGRWLSGILGELEFKRQESELKAFIERIKEKELGSRRHDLIVDLKIGDYHLVGKLEHRYENGVLLYRYADLKGKDFVIALLHHLIYCHIEERSTHLISKDKTLILKPDSVNKQLLIDWLEIYQRGQKQPTAFFVEAAIDYIEQANKGRAKKSPLDYALEEFSKAKDKDYEAELTILCQNIKELTEILGEGFSDYCERLLQAAWVAAHSNDAKSQ
ncbi:RecBCD enzyme subunit RecC [Patescibacteria group bacterium]|nr:RecBCD enzyme subunit RecC [Patescibacteria group bacterium]